MTPEHQILLAVVTDFVAEARERAPELAGLADREAAEAMTSWPRANEVRRAGAAAARANRYLEERPNRRGGRGRGVAGAATEHESAGRAFDAPGLHRLGVAGLLRSGHEFDADPLVREIAAYLAGPAEQLWRHLVLDIDWTVTTPVDVLGCRLWQPGSDDWMSLRPVPAAADYASNSIWDPLLMFGEHVVLSFPDVQAEATNGHRIWFFPRKGSAFSLAWEPLLLLNLWHDTPVAPIAEYLVEPRRTVDHVYASIPSKYLAGPDGDDELEVPLLGPLSIDDSQGPQFIRLLNELSVFLKQWDMSSKTPNGKKFVKTRDRLRRSAVRFLETGDDVSFDGDVFFPEDRPQVVFSYVSALENLLSAADEDKIDLRRRAAQRAAILVGRDDEQRKAIYEQVYSAYGVRNSIAHGSEPKSEMLADAVGHLRPILRRALIAVIVLGPQQELSEICDEALLSHTVLRDQIQAPIAKFHAAIEAG